MTEPCSNGLGADNFAIVWDPESRRLHGLNSSGTAPAAWTPQYFQRKYREQQIPLRGWDSVTVPGAVAGWSLLHGKFGKRTFADVLAPAIEYAEGGFAVSPTVQDKWVRATPLLRTLPGFADHFLPRGRAPEVGEHFVLSGAARTLKLIADTRGEAFYRGEIADAIERFAQTTGGAMTASDLSGYWDFVQSHGWVDTISTSFHGHDVHEIPPNGQGIAALSCLGILRHTQLPEYQVDSVDWHHVMIEAMKLAFADTYAYVGDPRSMTVTPAEMLNDDYLLRRAKLIDMRRAAQSCRRQATARRHDLPERSRRERHDGVASSSPTTWASARASSCQATASRCRTAAPAFHSMPASPNCVAPGKRPFHTIIPAFLMKDGAPQMSFGRDGRQHAAARPRADAGCEC